MHLSPRIAVLSLAGLFGLPFLAWHHALPLPGFHGEWLAALLGLGVLAILAGRETYRPLELPLALLLPLGLILILVVQASLGMVAFPGQARLAILYLATSALLMVAVRALARAHGHERVIEYAAWVMLASGLVNAAIAVLQWQGWHTPLDPIIAGYPGNHSYGNLGQANHFADQQALALCAGLYLAARRRLPTWALAVATLALLLGLTLSGSRSGWLYLAGLLGVSLLYRRSTRDETSRTLVRATFVALPAYLAIQLGVGLTETQVITATERLVSDAGSQATYTLDQRRMFLLAAKSMFLDSPVLGGGYQNFAWHYFQELAQLPAGVANPYEHIYAENAHNLVAHVLAEFGLAGGAILLVLAYWLYVSYRKVTSPERWMVLAMLAVIGLHSMLEYPLNYMYFLAVASVLAALANDHVLRVESVQRVGPAAAVLLAPVGIGLLAMLYIGNSALEALYRAYESPNVMRGWRDGTLQSYLVTASRMGFFEPSVDSFLVGLAVEVPDPRQMGAILPLSDRVMRRQANARNVYRHVLLSGLAGQDETYMRLYSQASRAYPGYRRTFRESLPALVAEHPANVRLRQVAETLYAADN